MTGVGFKNLFCFYLKLRLLLILAVLKNLKLKERFLMLQKQQIGTICSINLTQNFLCIQLI